MTPAEAGGISATGTGRVAPGTEAPELVVTVADDVTGAVLALHDGTRITVEGHTARVEGPNRDVLVVAGRRPVQRVHGNDVSVDLWAARHSRPFDASASTAAVAADAERLPRHDHCLTPPAPAPGEAAALTVLAPAGVVGGTVRATTDGSDPLDPTVPALVVALEPQPGGAAHSFTATLPGQPDGTWVRYAVELTGRAGDRTRVADAAPAYVHPLPGVDLLRPARSRYSYAVHHAAVPAWAQGAVVYHVLADRFAGPGGRPVTAEGDPPLLGFLGGTVDGIVARLDHVAALGADALLVSCLTPCDMHVGYDALATTGVDPRFGTEEDVRRLCAEAHRRGLRVLLDHEASYAGGRHPAVASARRDPSGPEGSWFLRDPATGRLLGWYGGNPTFVPFDHDHPVVREHLLLAARWWLSLGVDGFRLDSAHAAPLDFWAAFGRAVRGARPDALTFGEVTSSLADSLRLEGRLGGFHDFGLQEALRGFAGDGTVAPSGLDAVLSERDGLPPSLARLTFVECHDGDRFSHLAGGDRRRLLLALGLLLTLPGTPLLYYGTEVGLSQPGGGDPDLVARLPMPWDGDQDRELFAAVAGLVRRRRRTPALRAGRRRTLLVDDERSLYAFCREAEGASSVVVVVNAGTRPDRVEVAGLPRIDVPALSLSVTEVPR